MPFVSGIHDIVGGRQSVTYGLKIRLQCDLPDEFILNIEPGRLILRDRVSRYILCRSLVPSVLIKDFLVW